MSAAVEKEHDGGWFTRVFMDPMTEYTTFCRYEILHVAAWGADDKPEFRKRGTAFNDHVLTDNPADGHPEIHGDIKWDGCSHNYFDEGYQHSCGRGSLVALGPIFAYLYDEAEKMMRATGQHTEGLE